LNSRVSDHRVGRFDRILRSRVVAPIVILMLGAATTGMLAVRDRLDKAHVALVFLLVVLVGSAAGRLAGMLTGLTAFALFNFFFLQPYGTLLVSDPLDWLVLVTFLATSLVAAQLLHREREQARLAEQRSRDLEIADERAEQLRRADAMKDALLASVSHDLRTPLTTISGLAHELEREGSERARVIGAEADQLSRMVDQLLELSQLKAGNDLPESAINTVDDLVGGALQRVTAAWPQRVFAVDAGTEMLAGRFDLHQSIRIVANLLDNAAKYSTPGSPVELRVVREGDMLELTVRDSGPAIAAAEREKIFLPFYRAPGSVPDVRGSGLGLAIARQLAEMQHGSLHSRPNDQNGNDFILRLPPVDIVS
jgi:K+-sensing histidine kinase KdpD